MHFSHFVKYFLIADLLGRVVEVPINLHLSTLRNRIRSNLVQRTDSNTLILNTFKNPRIYSIAKSTGTALGEPGRRPSGCHAGYFGQSVAPI